MSLTIVTYLSSMFLAVAAALGLGVNCVPIAIAASVVVGCCALKVLRNPPGKLESSLLGIWSLFFGLSTSISQGLHFTNITAPDNYLDIGTRQVLAGCILGIVLWPIVVQLRRNASRLHLFNVSATGFSRRRFFVFWILIFAAWVPYLLTYYPGGIVGDGAHALEEALHAGPPTKSHWGVCHILVLRIFLKIGHLFTADPHLGIFLYIIASAIFVSGVFASVAESFAKRGAPKWLPACIAAVYAFSGFFASYAMALWKDGPYGAGVTLLVLLLWDVAEEGMASRRHIVRFALIGLFICMWRPNGVHHFLLTLPCVALLLRRRSRALVAVGVAVVAFSMFVYGPVHRRFDIKSDKLTESISIPLQQVAAVVRSGRPLTETQKAVLFDMIPEEVWRAKYTPSRSGPLKLALNQSRIKSQFPNFMKVWLQLLPRNLNTYFNAYLLETLGFWHPFSWRGHYLDYWLGIQDIHNRGFHKTDLFLDWTGVSAEQLLELNVRFISSGTMIWALFLSSVLVLCRRHSASLGLLPLSPLLAGWAILMVSTPMAYDYRYIVFLAFAWPVVFAMPFTEHENECGFSIRQNARSEREISKNSAMTVVALSFIALAMMFFLLAKSSTVQRFDGTPMDISFCNDKYNANRYCINGISVCEGSYSWASGPRLSMDIPVKSGRGKYSGDIDVKFFVTGTLGQSQRWIAHQDGDVVGSGDVSGKGTFTFRVRPVRRHARFTINFPDAVRPANIIKGSQDKRLLSVSIARVRLGAAPEDKKVEK